MKKEYIVNYKVENAAQWDGVEPHDEITENSDPVEAESVEEVIDLYADYIEEQARENGYEAERFVDTNGQTVVKTEKDGEAQYYILTGAKGEPLECYGVVTMWGEDGGAWELFETEDEARAEVEKRLAASTYTQKEIDRGHPYEEIALMAWDEDEDDYIYCDSIEYFYHEACR